MAIPSSFSDPAADAETDLVRRARAGDSTAQGELLQLHRRSAFLLAFQLLGDREEAMDATQDALLRFLTTLARFRVGDPVKPWLFTIVRNRCRDLLRRRTVRRADSLDAGFEDENTYVAEPVSDLPSPEDQLARRRLQERVWRALGRVSPAQREILVLRDYQDSSYQEIADLLEIPIGTVMSRLHRARRALAEHLGHGGHADG